MSKDNFVVLNNYDSRKDLELLRLLNSGYRIISSVAFGYNNLKIKYVLALELRVKKLNKISE